MKPDFEERDPSKPIGYGPDGKPVYNATPQSAQPMSHVKNAPKSQEGHPYDPKARVQYGNEPGVRHMTRDIEPETRGISDELERRHQESKARYPFLNLSKGEVVIMSVQRHPIGLFLPIGAGGIIFSILIAALVFYPADPESLGLPGFGLITVISALFMVLVGIGTFISTWVYLQNQFFLTNESVIQEIQLSLLSRREQTVSLGSIEDASFKKSGIFQTLLDYGTIRLSTEGEETTYRFHYVSNPRQQVAVLNNAVESFKNGRPVELDD